MYLSVSNNPIFLAQSKERSSRQEEIINKPVSGGWPSCISVSIIAGGRACGRENAFLRRSKIASKAGSYENANAWHVSKLT